MPGANAGAAEKNGRPEGGAAGVPITSEPPKEPKPPELPNPQPGEPDPIPKAVPTTPRPPANNGARSDRNPQSRLPRGFGLGQALFGIVLPEGEAATDPEPNAPRRPPAPPTPAGPPSPAPAPVRHPDRLPARDPPDDRPDASRPQPAADRRSPHRRAQAGGERDLPDRPRRVRHGDLPPAGADPLDGRARGPTAARDRQRGTGLPGEPGGGGDAGRREGRARSRSCACCRRPTGASPRHGQRRRHRGDEQRLRREGARTPARCWTRRRSAGSARCTCTGRPRRGRRSPSRPAAATCTTPAEKGWSKWTDEAPATEFLQVQSPPARFLQYRLTFTSNGGKTTPVIEEVNVAYQVPNLPPQIKSIKVTRPRRRRDGGRGRGGAAPGRPASAAPAASPAPARDDQRGRRPTRTTTRCSYSLYFRRPATARGSC